ncbi:MAG: hypothetical protein LIO43_03550 [Clostridiales bacterium]|nr:hypothetical protein [Clostridiales bacterium]
MIRKFEKEDLKAVSEIWLSSNTQAHSFIPKAYWKNNLPFLKKKSLILRHMFMKRTKLCADSLV